MRFEFYHAGLDDQPKLSIDGTVDNAIHFSHWEGNQTPPEVRADTSTEIALNLVTSSNRAELTRGIELVTNNHFDTDGVLSVWTVLTGERALGLREQLIHAAEAGDFSELPSEAAVRASIVIQGTDQPNKPTASPLACSLAGTTELDDPRCYELVFPHVERVLTNVGDYESLWREGWDQIATALESFERGSSKVTEYEDVRLSLVTIAPDAFSSLGYDPAQHATPYTAIGHYARGDLFLIAIPLANGWAYRIDYPYYSWAGTVVRPPIKRHDLAPVVAELNNLEHSPGGKWQLNRAELTAAVKFLDENGEVVASQLSPDVAAQIFRTHLAGQPDSGTRAAVR